MNELNRYCCTQYPDDDDNEIIKTNIKEFILFIHKLTKRNSLEKPNTVFNKNGINIRIILSVGDRSTGDDQINRIVELINSNIKKHINTIYIIGAGHKILYTTDMANKVKTQYKNYFDSPIVHKYKIKNKRKDFKSENMVKAICYEFNKC